MFETSGVEPAGGQDRTRRRDRHMSSHFPSQGPAVPSAFRTSPAILIVLYIAFHAAPIESAAQTKDPESESAEKPEDKQESTVTEIELPAAESSILENAAPGSIRASQTDSLASSGGDSTFIIAGDSIGTGSGDSLVVETRISPSPPPRVFHPDTLEAPLSNPTTMRLTRGQYTFTGYKDAGEAAALAPGLHARQTSLFGQPFYLVPPGGSGRDLLVLYRGRPYNDPVSGATDFSTFAIEEILHFDFSSAWDGLGPGTSGPMIVLTPPYSYSSIPQTRIVYRQGFYGLGHADWRIQQQVGDSFRYHIGIDVGEYRGRLWNSTANSSQIRLGAQQHLNNWGRLGVYWMQARITHGRVFEPGTLKQHRNDLDIIWNKGERDDRHRFEAAAWYVRSQRGYSHGDEDGNRLGARLRYSQLYHNHLITLALDREIIAARFNRDPLNPTPKGDRTIYGLTLSDKADMKLLRFVTAVRGETGDVPEDSAGSNRTWIQRFSGAASLDFGDTLGPGILATASRSWRWPALDETYGSWRNRSPERLLLPIGIPDSLISYSGDYRLEPTGGTFAGIGARWNVDQDRFLRIVTGLRTWSGPIFPKEIAQDVWTSAEGEDISQTEITAIGWIDMIGPWSLAGSATWIDDIDRRIPVPETWGWASLRFERPYYNGQLRMRIGLTANYLGEYWHDRTRREQEWIFDGLISARVFRFEVYWGTNNLRDGYYEWIPGFPIMHRDEIWGVRWLLFE